MNNEIESYPGELRGLRAREIKLANLLTVMEEYIQGGFNSGGNSSTGNVTIKDVERVLNEPELAMWLDKMRASGRSRHKRFK